MKKGFTLVELAIVLVIIGLLASGVLVAQTMIETARIQAFTLQIQQLDAAVANFKTKYNGIPGDSQPFGGNGDGHLDVGIADDNWNAFPETANFYVHLNLSGFAPELKFTSTITGGVTSNSPNPNVLASKIGKNAVILGTSGANTFSTNPCNQTMGGACGVPVPVDHYLLMTFSPNNPMYFGDVYYNKGGNGGAAGITPIQSYAIDNKLDDGQPLSGMVRGTRFSSSAAHCVMDENNDNTSYNTTGEITDPECQLSIRMLSQTGL